MGFSTSGAVAILFVGLLIAVGIAFPAVESAVDRQSSAIDDRDDRALDLRNTAIDVETEVDGADEVIVEMTNDGSTTLSVTETDLLLDGEYIPPSDYETTVDGDPDRTLVQPGETLRIETGETDVDRVKMITEHGIAQTVTEVT